MLFPAAATAAFLIAAASTADAKPCRDASGKFAACPSAAAAAAPAGKCRDAKGRFAACPAPAASAARSAPASRSSAPTGAAANTAAIARAPAGTASAQCKDGTLSYSKHRIGTCAGHHGVATWLAGAPPA